MDKYLISMALTITVFVIVSTQVFHSPEVKTNNGEAISNAVQQADNTQPILGYVSAHGPLPSSLEGTVMQQALVQDEQGNLIVTPDLKRIFNYFLSANQEESLDKIILRIEEYLAFYLSGAALQQAESILQGYINYKRALVDFEAEYKALSAGNTLASEGYGVNRLNTMQALLLKRRELRQTFMSAQTVDVFYQKEDQYDDYMLEKLKIAARTDLDLAEKRELVKQLDNNSDPEWIESRKEATLAADVREATNELSKQGASEEEIRSLRMKMVGVEATTRLEALDKERAQWRSRVDEFLTERQSILEQTGLDAEEKALQVATLKQEKFNRREQIRVSVYERQSTLK